jgi:predicted O-methyltransferase YrrM
MDPIAQIIDGVYGWCSLHKAHTLYDLARSEGCEIAVEIGVFGGKSLFPIAKAFSDKGSGKIYGIEPWENDIAVETPTSEENDQWWRSLDFPMVKRAFLVRLAELSLEKHVKLLEVPSDAATLVFQSPRFAGKIDLVHIDGSHSLEESAFDSTHWFRLLRSGGHIVLDDINWETLDVAFRFMSGVAELVHRSEGEENGHFAVFRKR